MRARNLFSALAAVLCLSVGVAQAADKTFVYCSEGSPSTFNPQLATDGPTFNASSRMIYNRLVDFKQGGTEIIPSLAESWTVSKDGLEFTFKLRKDVSFQKTENFTPKRKFNADDVIWSFQRMKDPSHPFHKVNGGSYEYFSSMEMDKIIKDIVKIDAYTIKFVLSRPEAPFLANLGMDFASITSAEYGTQLLTEGTPEKLDTEPVGTGPFVFKRYVKDTMIRYEANREYFLGAPKLDKVVFAITKDPSVRFQKLKTGECHLIAEPSPTDLKAMMDNPKITVLQQDGLNVGYVAMNTEKKPFDNVLVRRAVHHALNRGSYIDAIYLGNAKVAVNPIPPSMWSWNSKTKDYKYDPKEAKDLLKKAGFPNGFETELWTLPVSRPYMPNGKKLGEMIQADLAKIGVKVKLVSYDWPTYLAKARKGEHSMIQLGWTGDNGDPDNFLNVLLGCAAIEAGSNVARWCDKDFAQLINRAKTITNIKKRTTFYKKAQMIFKQEAPWVTVAHSTVFRAMSSSVKGYKLSPFGTESFYEVDLK
ncbi:MAG: ABC transporter substrate-binding protein [Bdellovibrionaceae bacterium]|nr:ABC transporter substrate-binding protein [Bdellovibrionales bacterium]MCB9084966.1 ABC transporter substrate-binding protein [Pseudobdellovibrionaceae bacterium]